MKKILILLISLSILIPFNISAKDEKVLTIDMSQYQTSMEIPILKELYLSLAMKKGLLNEIEENGKEYLANQSGKKLIVFENDEQDEEYNNSYRILDNVGTEDTIEYTVTTEDIETSINKDDLQKKIYDKVIIKFGPQKFPEIATDYIIEIRPGYTLLEDYGVAMAMGVLNGPVNDMFQYAVELEFKSLSGKKLAKIAQYSNNYEDITIDIPDNVTKEDDIVYNLTPEEKDNMDNQYNKIIINFSGFDYSSEQQALVINVKDKNALSYLSQAIFSGKTNIKSKLQIDDKYILCSKQGKKLAYFPIEMPTKEIKNEVDVMSLMGPTVIYDGVGEADTIYYDINDSSNLRRYIPRKYNRLVIKFMPEEKTTPTKPNRTILVNPQTLNNLLIIFGVLIAITASTILIKKQNY